MSWNHVGLVLDALAIISVVFVFVLRNRPGEPVPQRYTVSLLVMHVLAVAATAIAAINPHSDPLSRVLSAIAGAAFLCSLVIVIRKVRRGDRRY